MRKLTILLTLAASLILSINPCPASPPIFLRSTGSNVQSSGSTYAVADSVLGSIDNMDFDWSSGTTAAASSVAAINSGDNSATANFQSVASTGVDGQTVLSTPALTQGVLTLQVEEDGSASSSILAYTLWDAEYVLDDEGGARDSSATYLVTITVDFSWVSGVTPGDLNFENVTFGSPDDKIQVNAGGATVAVRYIGDGTWQATNGVVTDTYEIEDNAVSIVISREIVLDVNDTVSIEGILGISTAAGIHDGTYLGSGTLDVDVTLTPITP